MGAGAAARLPGPRRGGVPASVARLDLPPEGVDQAVELVRDLLERLVGLLLEHLKAGALSLTDSGGSGGLAMGGDTFRL